jgi:hypothetical protein
MPIYLAVDIFQVCDAVFRLCDSGRIRLRGCFDIPLPKIQPERPDFVERDTQYSEQ